MKQPLIDSIQNTLQHLQTELLSIRTGRANPALIEDLEVPCYGAVSPLQQVASISAPEPRLLVVQPWDVSIIKDIEKAITQSPLGINPVVDGKIIRLPFPQMTEERRLAMSKLVQEKAEQAKVRVRTAREEVMKIIKTAEKDGTLSQDAAKSEMESVQKEVETSSATILDMAKKKTEEIMTI